jgi:hypothetical protein
MDPSLPLGIAEKSQRPFVNCCNADLISVFSSGTLLVHLETGHHHA